MIRSRKRLALCAVLIAFNAAFIWGNSLLSREMSAAFSKLVGQLIDWLFPSQVTVAEGKGNGVLRKIAHFTEFCTLGMLLCWMIGMLRQKSWEWVCYSLAVGTAVACLDEMIQCFVPGRGPGIRDVAIDTAGVLLGVGILLSGYLLKQKNKKRSR